MSENKNPDNAGLYAILVCAVCILGVSFIEKSMPRILEWYFSHRLLLSAIIAAVTVLSGYAAYAVLRKKYLSYQYDKSITSAEASDAVFMGYSDDGKPVYLNTSHLITHSGIVGTTKSGKSESFILPVAIDAIEKGRGFVIIDGKADRPFLDKLYAYAVKSGRSKDFRLFSLSDTEASHTYNPLSGDRIDQVAEKVFKSFGFQNEHYANAQYEVLKNTLHIFSDAEETATFLKLWQAISDPAKIYALSMQSENPMLKDWARQFLNEDKSSRFERVSGSKPAAGNTQ